MEMRESYHRRHKIWPFPDQRNNKWIKVTVYFFPTSSSSKTTTEKKRNNEEEGVKVSYLDVRRITRKSRSRRGDNDWLHLASPEKKIHVQVFEICN